MVTHDRVFTTGLVEAPSDWGLLLTTINVGPRRPTSITTFAEKIAVACEDVVNIYDAVTFSIEQSLHTTRSVTKIQGSSDGCILYSAHSNSITSWDVQTGGLIDTFHPRSEINDTAISPTDSHIACGLSDGSVALWNAHTKNEVAFGNGQPVVTICWLSSTELAVATQDSVYIADTTAGDFSGILKIPDLVWGMVIFNSEVVMVGTSKPGAEGDRELCTLNSITCKRELPSRSQRIFRHMGGQSPAYRGQLRCPLHVRSEIACITPPSGVQVFNAINNRWIKPSLLEKAESVAVSLARNLVVQTKDSVQIFSLEVLTSDASRENAQLSHIYPLGEKHAAGLRINRHLTVIELETLRILRPGVDGLPLGSLLAKSPASARSRGLVAEFGVSMVIQAWQSLAPLPRWAEAAEEDALLGGLSPTSTRIATLYGLPHRELRVKDVTDGTILAKLPLEDDDREGTDVAYDLTFDSETEFSLKVDGPGRHVKILYDISTSPSGQYPYSIKQGESVPLSEPRTTSPYTLDASREWALDAQSRKICWVPPENMRRRDGEHFWAGTSLVMLGSDGVVRKLCFKEPDC